MRAFLEKLKGWTGENCSTDTKIMSVLQFFPVHPLGQRQLYCPNKNHGDAKCATNALGVASIYARTPVLAAEI